MGLGMWLMKTAMGSSADVKCRREKAHQPTTV